MTHKQKSVSEAMDYITSTIMELDDIQEINKELRGILNDLYDAGYYKKEKEARKLDNFRFRHGELR